MASVSKDALREGFQGVLEGFAVMEVHVLRQYTAIQQGRASLLEEWKRLDLGEAPEFEPEIRLRKVSA